MRSLALFRAGLGIYTAVDVLLRLRDLRAFYTDFGVLPRSAVAGEFANYWHISLHMASDAMWWQILLVLLCALAAFSLTVGYRTWTATLICWILSVSIQNRNDPVLDGGDMIHRLLLFWAMFLPLGRIWSVDAIRSGVQALACSYHYGLASIALTVQMATIFLMAAKVKSGVPWRRDFNAVWIVLNWDVYTTAAGIWIRQFHGLMRFFTIGAQIIEGIGPLLLFVPWAPIRVLAIFFMIGLHASFVIVMKLFGFASIMSLGWFSLMPGWFWDKLGVPLEMNERWRRWFTRLSDMLPGGAGWQPVERWPRAAAMFVAVCLIYVCCWNVRAAYPRFKAVFPNSLDALGYTLRIDQFFFMFAPAPVREDGWYVVPGRLADGRAVDAFRGGPLTWDRPASIADSYINRRWRRYLWIVTEARSAAHRKYFASYVCREWERTHDEVLQGFDVVLMMETANFDYTVTPPKKVVLWEGQKCH